MQNLYKFIILCFLLNYSLINCKKKKIKKPKKNPKPVYYHNNIYNNQNYIPPADFIRPSEVSRELFCDTCQALFTEAVKNLRNLIKEKDVTYYLQNNICSEDNFKGYHFTRSDMEEACEIFIGHYYDEFEKTLMERIPNKDTNETLIKKFCYRKIKACNGVDLSKYLIAKTEVIDGELYDVETEEKIYKVMPKIEDVSLDEYENESETEFMNQSNKNKSGEL